jgi:hypothetical protein
MSRVHRLTALVFMVLWVPITAHCCLEKLPGLEFLHCVSDTPESSNCEGDGCQVVESGFYKIPDNPATVPVPLTCFVAYIMPRPADDHQSACIPVRLLSVSPPDLLHRWQFISRAALLVRAPSFAS